jgi:hypothetical protein
MYEIGHSPTVVIATDTIKAKKHIDLPDLTKRLLALPDNKTEHLPGYLPLVPGMPARQYRLRAWSVEWYTRNLS